jgi:hypothetical protein
MVSGLAASLQSANFDAQLAASSGAALQITGSWRPVIALGAGKMRGGLLHANLKLAAPDGAFRTVSAEQLNSVEVERVDLAALEHGVAALPPADAADTPPLAVLPIAWSTVRSARARKRLLRLAADMQLQKRMAPVAEIYGIEAGTPPSALREGSGALRPIFRAVFARVQPRKASINELVDCGLSGATAEGGDLQDTEGDKEMLRTVLSLQRVGPTVVIHALRSVQALTAARQAGAAWASLDLQRSGWHVAHAATEALAAEAV